MYSSITILGNLGKDVEMRYTPSGQAVSNFSVATSRKYKTGEDWKTETVWFRVSVWGKMAEACNSYLHKGSKVLVVGRLVPDPATGGPRIWKSETGESKSSFEIHGQEVKFLDPRGDGKSSEEAASAEELPF